MKFRYPLILAITTLVTAQIANGQQPGVAAGERAATAATQPPNLFDPFQSGAAVSSSDVRSSKMTAAELRQARAQYRSRQRIARLEYNLWMGYEPLRPNWNSIPMMSSRYTNRRVYVPVYVHTR